MFQELFSELGGQQSEIDSLNLLGKQIIGCNDSSIRDDVQTHLQNLNDNWDRVRERAMTKSRIQTMSPDQRESYTISNGARNDEEPEETVVLPYRNVRMPEMTKSESLESALMAQGDVPDKLEDDAELKASLQEIHLKYQLIFTDLFDWLVNCEESLRKRPGKHLELEELKSKMAELMVLYLFLYFYDLQLWLFTRNYLFGGWEGILVIGKSRLRVPPSASRSLQRNPELLYPDKTSCTRRCQVPHRLYLFHCSVLCWPMCRRRNDLLVSYCFYHTSYSTVVFLLVCCLALNEN